MYSLYVNNIGPEGAKDLAQSVVAYCLSVRFVLIVKHLIVNVGNIIVYSDFGLVVELVGLPGLKN